MTFLQRRTLKSLQRSATGVTTSSLSVKKLKIITLEQTDQETVMSPVNNEAEIAGHHSLQPIEEEDRDGSSRREDDDMERGFSITYD